jgi:class 3 adenylate cyclase
MALHGSLRGFNQLLDGAGPEEATEALNDYFLSAASIVRACGGHFECYTGASFGAAWELVEGASPTAQGQALLCALSLRAEMVRLNESRKLDGKKPLKQGMGLHIGQALWARIGAVPDLRVSVMGEALACARALDRLALAEGKDFVVSQDVLKSARGVFSGKGLGEARLTADTGLTAYFVIMGFNEDASLAEGVLEPGTFGGQDPGAVAAGERLTGGESRVAIARPEAAPSRWLVNNGSQIVGPFTVQQLSKMLFAQELDFDCECWHEETGRSSRLDAAGAFSGSQDADASYWVYDGELVHGPVSEGFIRTALQHGAFNENAAACEKTTIAGWKKLTVLVAELTGRKPGTDSGATAA